MTDRWLSNLPTRRIPLTLTPLLHRPPVGDPAKDATQEPCGRTELRALHAGNHLHRTTRSTPARWDSVPSPMTTPFCRCEMPVKGANPALRTGAPTSKDTAGGVRRMPHRLLELTGAGLCPVSQPPKPTTIRLPGPPQPLADENWAKTQRIRSTSWTGKPLAERR